MISESLPAYSGFAGGAGGRAYNEAAFRHFLAIERRRAQCSMGSALLILVTVRQRPGSAARLSDTTAAAIFRGLGESVREVDFVGWFRDRRVAGAVLAQSSTTATDSARQLMVERVKRTLAQQLLDHDSQRLHVRVVPLARDTASQPARALSGY